MTRITRRATVPPRTRRHARADRRSHRASTEEELELGVAGLRRGGHGHAQRGPGQRPWAYWRFELGEEPPQDDRQPIRLAELGLLRDDEVAAIAERANEARPRIGTTAEHYGPNCWPDRDAVELHEAVTAALQARR